MTIVNRIKQMFNIGCTEKQSHVKQRNWLLSQLNDNLGYIELIKMSPDIAQYVAATSGEHIVITQEVMCRSIETRTESLADMIVWVNALTQAMITSTYTPGVPPNVRRGNGSKLVLHWLPDRKLANFNALVYKPLAKSMEHALIAAESLNETQCRYIAMLSNGLSHDLRQYYREILLESLK